MSKMKNLAVVLASSLAVGSMVTTASASEAIGSVRAENSVVLVNNGISSVVKGNQVYFAGDKIETVEGSVAAVSLQGGNAVYLSGDGAATVNHGATGYEIDVESGHLGFSFQSGVDYSIRVNGYTVSPADTVNTSSGMVATSESNGAATKMAARSGEIVVTSDSGEIQILSPGQQVASSNQVGKYLPVQVVDQIPLWLVIVGGVVAGAIVIDQLDDDDDDIVDSQLTGGDDSGVASPSS